jgi:cytidine deaminase
MAAPGGSVCLSPLNNFNNEVNNSFIKVLTIIVVRTFLSQLFSMDERQYSFAFKVYNSIDELNNEDALLLRKAREITHNAYAPYSHFSVGAVARLNNGAFINGTNQENASFPAGICAERVLLSSVSSQYLSNAIEAIAISYYNQNVASDKPVSPCGICRQTLLEYEERQEQPIRLILGGMEGEVYVIPRASLLLPLSFGSKIMKTV